MAIACVVVAWLFIPIASQIFAFFDSPNRRIVVLLVILDFATTLTLVRGFELRQ
jgi:hypothetical protein